MENNNFLSYNCNNYKNNTSVCIRKNTLHLECKEEFNNPKYFDIIGPIKLINSSNLITSQIPNTNVHFNSKRTNNYRAQNCFYLKDIKKLDNTLCIESPKFNFNITDIKISKYLLGNYGIKFIINKNYASECYLDISNYSLTKILKYFKNFKELKTFYFDDSFDKYIIRNYNSKHGINLFKSDKFNIIFGNNNIKFNDSFSNDSDIKSICANIKNKKYPFVIYFDKLKYKHTKVNYNGIKKIFYYFKNKTNRLLYYIEFAIRSYSPKSNRKIVIDDFNRNNKNINSNLIINNKVTNTLSLEIVKKDNLDLNFNNKTKNNKNNKQSYMSDYESNKYKVFNSNSNIIRNNLSSFNCLTKQEVNPLKTLYSDDTNLSKNNTRVFIKYKNSYVYLLSKSLNKIISYCKTKDLLDLNYPKISKKCKISIVFNTTKDIKINNKITNVYIKLKNNYNKTIKLKDTNSLIKIKNLQNFTNIKCLEKLINIFGERYITLNNNKNLLCLDKFINGLKNKYILTLNCSSNKLFIYNNPKSIKLSIYSLYKINYFMSLNSNINMNYCNLIDKYLFISNIEYIRFNKKTINYLLKLINDTNQYSNFNINLKNIDIIVNLPVYRHNNKNNSIIYNKAKFLLKLRSYANLDFKKYIKYYIKNSFKKQNIIINNKVLFYKLNIFGNLLESQYNFKDSCDIKLKRFSQIFNNTLLTNNYCINNITRKFNFNRISIKINNKLIIIYSSNTLKYINKLFNGFDIMDYVNYLEYKSKSFIIEGNQSSKTNNLKDNTVSLALDSSVNIYKDFINNNLNNLSLTNNENLFEDIKHNKLNNLNESTIENLNDRESCFYNNSAKNSVLSLKTHTNEINNIAFHLYSNEKKIILDNQIVQINQPTNLNNLYNYLEMLSKNYDTQVKNNYIFNEINLHKYLNNNQLDFLNSDIIRLICFKKTFFDFKNNKLDKIYNTKVRSKIISIYVDNNNYSNYINKYNREKNFIFNIANNKDKYNKNQGLKNLRTLCNNRKLNKKIYIDKLVIKINKNSKILEYNTCINLDNKIISLINNKTDLDFNYFDIVKHIYTNSIDIFKCKNYNLISSYKILDNLNNIYNTNDRILKKKIYICRLNKHSKMANKLFNNKNERNKLSKLNKNLIYNIGYKIIYKIFLNTMLFKTIYKKFCQKKIIKNIINKKYLTKNNLLKNIFNNKVYYIRNKRKDKNNLIKKIYNNMLISKICFNNNIYFFIRKHLKYILLTNILLSFNKKYSYHQNTKQNIYIDKNIHKSINKYNFNLFLKDRCSLKRNVIKKMYIKKDIIAYFNYLLDTTNNKNLLSDLELSKMKDIIKSTICKSFEYKILDKQTKIVNKLVYCNNFLNLTKDIIAKNFNKIYNINLLCNINITVKQDNMLIKSIFSNKDSSNSNSKLYHTKSNFFYLNKIKVYNNIKILLKINNLTIKIIRPFSFIYNLQSYLVKNNNYLLNKNKISNNKLINNELKITNDNFLNYISIIVKRSLNICNTKLAKLSFNYSNEFNNIKFKIFKFNNLTYNASTTHKYNLSTIKNQFYFNNFDIQVNENNSKFLNKALKHNNCILEKNNNSINLNIFNYNLPKLNLIKLYRSEIYKINLLKINVYNKETSFTYYKSINSIKFKEDSYNKMTINVIKKVPFKREIPKIQYTSNNIYNKIFKLNIDKLENFFDINKNYFANNINNNNIFIFKTKYSFNNYYKKISFSKIIINYRSLINLQYLYKNSNITLIKNYLNKDLLKFNFNSIHNNDLKPIHRKINNYCNFKYNQIFGNYKKLVSIFYEINENSQNILHTLELNKAIINSKNNNLENKISSAQTENKYIIDNYYLSLLNKNNKINKKHSFNNNLQLQLNTLNPNKIKKSNNSEIIKNSNNIYKKLSFSGIGKNNNLNKENSSNILTLKDNELKSIFNQSIIKYLKNKPYALENKTLDKLSERDNQCKKLIINKLDIENNLSPIIDKNIEDKLINNNDITIEHLYNNLDNRVLDNNSLEFKYENTIKLENNYFDIFSNLFKKTSIINETNKYIKNKNKFLESTLNRVLKIYKYIDDNNMIEDKFLNKFIKYNENCSNNNINNNLNLSSNTESNYINNTSNNFQKNLNLQDFIIKKICLENSSNFNQKSKYEKLEEKFLVNRYKLIQEYANTKKKYYNLVDIIEHLNKEKSRLNEVNESLNAINSIPKKDILKFASMSRLNLNKNNSLNVCINVLLIFILGISILLISFLK